MHTQTLAHVHPTLVRARQEDWQSQLCTRDKCTHTAVAACFLEADARMLNPDHSSIRLPSFARVLRYETLTCDAGMQRVYV